MTVSPCHRRDLRRRLAPGPLTLAIGGCQVQSGHVDQEVQCRMPVCQRCHQQILDPADDVRMVEVIQEQTFGGEPGEPADGRTVHFHREHVPQDPGHYRLPSE